MADIINLRLARKTKLRAERVVKAAENRRKHGRSRSERTMDEAEKRLADSRLDGHQRSEAPEPLRDENEESCSEAFHRDRGS
jgi:hypothetical protein